jgi:hypothetical protein
LKAITLIGKLIQNILHIHDGIAAQMAKDPSSSHYLLCALVNDGQAPLHGYMSAASVNLVQGA